ncbi:hypothetical protein [Kitasatospora sp. NPDC018619]|uniref:hypothetical protein n=1 Tax=unclassified Kitasatospora TaxID=2633591 RepID=UPI003790CA2D
MTRRLRRSDYKDDRTALFGGRVDHVVRAGSSPDIVITACGKIGRRATQPTGRPCTPCTRLPWTLDQRTYQPASET